jgi:hypothetical protein
MDQSKSSCTVGFRCAMSVLGEQINNKKDKKDKKDKK